MKRKNLISAVAIGSALMLMLSGCGSLMGSANQQSGPINQRQDEDSREDDEEEVIAEDVTEEDITADDVIEEDVTPEDVVEDVVEDVAEVVAEDVQQTEFQLSFDPADRPNATTGYGSARVLEAGCIAPDFTVELTNGETFTLSDHDDGMVLINIWATWCGPCVGEMPELEELAKEGIENFDLVCINCGEDKDTVSSFVADEGFDFNIAYDPDYTVCDYYPTDYIPYTVIVKNGIVCETYVGAPASAYESYKKEILRFMNE